jgi:hypothetical protein
MLSIASEAKAFFGVGLALALRRQNNTIVVNNFQTGLQGQAIFVPQQRVFIPPPVAVFRQPVFVPQQQFFAPAGCGVQANLGYSQFAAVGNSCGVGVQGTINLRGGVQGNVNRQGNVNFIRR